MIQGGIITEECSTARLQPVMYQLFKHPGSHPLTSLRLNCSICQFIKSATCMTASNRHAPKGCIHPANLAKHLLTFHNSRHSLEEIQHQIDRLALNYPPHEGPHPLVPFFLGGILPPAIPGVAREIGFYCTICRNAHKGDKKAGYARLITHLQQGAPWPAKPLCHPEGYHPSALLLWEVYLLFPGRSFLFRGGSRSCPTSLPAGRYANSKHA